jgi:hypothetical protein
LEAAFLEQQQRGAGGNQLGIGEHPEQVIGAQRDLRFLVGPSGTIHIHQIPADQHRGRHAGQDIAVDQPAHDGMGRPEVVASRRYFHVLHFRLHFHSRHARCVRAVLCPHYQRTKQGVNRCREDKA